MQSQRLTGPGAGAEKYDLLTALAVRGLAVGGTLQASMMRLMALVTARYNWLLDEVTIGQREMAALWSVDERTAKRETRRLIEAGLLEIKRPGVRGRVAAYRLRSDEIYRQTEDLWQKVGRDFEARMGGRQQATTSVPQPTTANVVQVDFAPKPAAATREQAVSTQATAWSRCLARLAADHPSLYAAWFRQLEADAPDHEGVLHIRAPSRFAATYLAARHLTTIERAVLSTFGRKLRCHIFA